MAKLKRAAKKIGCFTEEQQKYYASLETKQRLYVELRGQGYTKREAYMMAGYKTKTPSQAAFNLEYNNPRVVELISVLMNVNTVKDVVNGKKNNDLTQRIDALALQNDVDKAIDRIEGADSETAKRIKFYRDIANGEIKTVKQTTVYDKDNNVVKKTVEEVNDIDSRIKARKELDRILGLNSVIDLDSLRLGDITINIVDANKKDETEDERNKIYLNPDDVTVIDGEKMIVVDNKTSKEKENTKEKTVTVVKDDKPKDFESKMDEFYDITRNSDDWGDT